MDNNKSKEEIQAVFTRQQICSPPLISRISASFASFAIEEPKSSPPTISTSSSGTPDETIQAEPHLDLLQFIQKYHEHRDSETVKKNEKFDANAAASAIKKKKKIFCRRNVPSEIVNQTKCLPIYAKKNELIKLIKNNQIVIVQGETGSGKSTQIPQYIANAEIFKDGTKIGITQPRRVAAKSLAERVAVECGVELGSTVGFAVRFESCVSSKTIIKYMTDGILVKDCTQEEPDLQSYSVIIIDEAHERSIHTDVAFGLLKRAAKNRPDLKIIISSATLEVAKFSQFFDDAPVFPITGRGYDVQVIYEPSINYLSDVVKTIIKINEDMSQPKGDVLVFLTGQDDIEEVHAQLDGYCAKNHPSLIIFPCYGTLLFEEQQRIFELTPPDHRKIVLSTNIAETSITIDGIVFVIDCGFVKQKRYNPSTKIECLVKVPISKFQAIQRQGRAGRTQPGICYRLYSEASYNEFKEAPVPDIQRSNVESVVLDLLAMGIDNPLKFGFVDAPSSDAIGEALISLQELSALDATLKITPLGRQMAAYPLDPPLAKVLITSAKLGITTEILKIASILSTQHQTLFVRNKSNRDMSRKVKEQQFDQPEGDHLTYLRIYDQWKNNQYSEEWCKRNFIQYKYLTEAQDIKNQLKDIMIKNKLLTTKGYGHHTCEAHQLKDNICKAFTAGYFFQLGKKRPTGFGYEKYSSSGEKKEVFLHPSSALFKLRPLPQWIIFQEVVETSKPYAVGVSVIRSEWVNEYAPKFWTQIQQKYSF